MNAPIHLLKTLHKMQLSPWEELPVARINDHQLILIEAKGEYPWHQHDERDDGFLVLSGCLQVELPDQTVTVRAGELFVVPKGVAYRTISTAGAQVLLFETVDITP